MSNTAHFIQYLQKYPNCRKILQLICDAWKRYGRLPARILLSSNASSIEPCLLEIFGPGSLHLSKNGSVTLITDRLFEPQADEKKLGWIKEIHEACGIPFVKKVKPETILEEYNVAIRKWSLMFPALSELTLVFNESWYGGYTIQEKLDLWIKAGKIVSFLMQNRDTLTVSDLGARFCGDSKMLRGGELILLVADWLVFLDTGIHPNNNEINAEYRKILRKQILEHHGIIENRCSVAVTVFGPIVFEKKGKRIDHVFNRWKEGEAALLSLENIDDINKIEILECSHMYTCENESPFANLVRKKHPGVIIYTRGFPNSAVCKLYSMIALHYPDMARFHWGDTDLAGLQIASIFHKIAPVRLWRCDLDKVSENLPSLIMINEKERSRIKKFLENNTDFPFRDVLEFTCRYGWLEQELSNF